MKKIGSLLLCLIIIIMLVGCEGMSISQSKYDEISKYVKENGDTISINSDPEFFIYKTTGLSIGGVDYGYYYSSNGEVLVPDYYNGGDLGDKTTKDGGTYFGTPNNGTDWCFVKQIVDNWYYYELHCG